MSQPLVSIHIITYNQKKFIHETLNSALGQDYENIQIIVADDGSTDGTKEIIMEYAQQFPDKIIPLVDGPNLGITGNSNRGLTACTGKYVSFLGGDDIMFPNKISSQVALMESDSSIALCFHDLEVFNDKTGETMYLFNKKITPREGCVKALIKHGCINGGSSTMLRRTCAPQGGFDVHLPVASDWLYWIETLLQSNGKIRFINKALGRYRRHDENITNYNHGDLSRAVRDHLATCTKILYTHPEYSKQVLYRIGTIMRGLRHNREYLDCLICSLRCSLQLKTLVIFITYIASFGTLKK